MSLDGSHLAPVRNVAERQFRGIAVSNLGYTWNALCAENALSIPYTKNATTTLRMRIQIPPLTCAQKPPVSCAGTRTHVQGSSLRARQGAFASDDRSNGREIYTRRTGNITLAMSIGRWPDASCVATADSHPNTCAVSRVICRARWLALTRVGRAPYHCHCARWGPLEAARVVAGGSAADGGCRSLLPVTFTRVLPALKAPAASVHCFRGGGWGPLGGGLCLTRSWCKFTWINYIPSQVTPSHVPACKQRNAHATPSSLSLRIGSRGEQVFGSRAAGPM